MTIDDVVSSEQESAMESYSSIITIKFLFNEMFINRYKCDL